jgi:hypothetical protein
VIVVSGLPGIKHKFFAKEIDSQLPYSHCYNNFSLPRVDLGMITEVEYKQDYNLLKDDSIIGGTFSRVFLEQLSKDFNINVLNILRHPTTSYLTGIEDLFEDDELPVGLEYVTPVTTSSIIDSITLSKLNYVTTIKFEDVIKNNQFEFMGKIINCPSVHNNFNGFITRYESVMIKRGDITSSMVDKFNNIFSNLNTSFVNCHNDERLPSNVFKELGYNPMSLQEILNESI